MQTIHLHPKFYRVSVARLSDEAQQRWHRLNLYQQLRTEGCSEANAGHRLVQGELLPLAQAAPATRAARA